MKFQRCHEHKEDYTIIKVSVAINTIDTCSNHVVNYKFQADAVLFEEASSVYSADTFNHLNPERLPSSISSLLDTPDKAIEHTRKNNQHMRVLKEYKEDIHKKLREGLQWMFDKNLKPKLEGRYVIVTVCHRRPIGSIFFDTFLHVTALASCVSTNHYQTSETLKVLM